MSKSQKKKAAAAKKKAAAADTEISKVMEETHISNNTAGMFQHRQAGTPLPVLP